MSDTEEESTFDKEAEKERLREQLRREEEDRRATQHMSELLLKGATMTNKHCDTCGDPLFRYEGREFCPTCAQEEAATSGDAGSVDEAAGAGDGTTAGGTGEPGPRLTEGGTGGVERGTAGTGPERTHNPASAGGTTPAPTPRGQDLPEDVAAARAALVRKLSALAHQAEATDDVGRSRELLAAAREAAEALSAIDGIRG